MLSHIQKDSLQNNKRIKAYFVKLVTCCEDLCWKVQNCVCIIVLVKIKSYLTTTWKNNSHKSKVIIVITLQPSLNSRNVIIVGLRCTTESRIITNGLWWGDIPPEPKVKGEVLTSDVSQPRELPPPPSQPTRDQKSVQRPSSSGRNSPTVARPPSCAESKNYPSCCIASHGNIKPEFRLWHFVEKLSPHGQTSKYPFLPINQ